jgi:hypothetical protein
MLLRDAGIYDALRAFDSILSLLACEFSQFFISRVFACFQVPLKLHPESENLHLQNQRAFRLDPFSTPALFKGAGHG